jgi:transposase
VRQCVQNKIPFRYVLNDTWFASVDNMKLVKTELKRDFIMPVKTNRKLALSLADKKQSHYVGVDTLDLEPDTCLTIYLEGLDFRLLLVKQIFTNADGSVGILYLVTSDIDLTYDQITTIYGERWNVEPYHKSLKQNASLTQSPTKTVTTQSNHFFAAVCAFIKLEMLKCATQANHFALKSRRYMQALRTAFDAFHELNPISFSA